MGQQKPWIGATVHYSPYNGDANPWGPRPWPALVQSIGSDDWTCRLLVVAPQGVYMDYDVRFASEPEDGAWFWPPQTLAHDELHAGGPAEAHNGSGAAPAAEKKRKGKAERKAARKVKALKARVAELEAQLEQQRAG